MGTGGLWGWKGPGGLDHADFGVFHESYFSGLLARYISAKPAYVGHDGGGRAQG